MSADNEKFIREQVRKILLEYDDLGGSWVSDAFGAGPHLDLYKAFVEPFTDVFKVAFVAAKDITSAALDITDYALTFNAEKQADIKERFRQRRVKYKDEMNKAMASTTAAFAGEDARAFTFLAAPQLVLAKAAAGLAWDASEPVRDKVEDFFGGTLGIGDTAVSASTSSDKSPGLMADLKRAFFGEGLDEVDEIELILIEQEKKEKFEVPSEKELEEMALEFMKESGFDEKVDEFWDVIIDDKKKEIDEILELQRAKVQGLTELASATSLQEAAGAVDELKALDVDFSAPLAQITAAMEEESRKLQAGGEEVEEIIAQLRKSPEAKSIPKDAPVEEYFPLIEAGLLATTFGSVVEEAKNESASELLGFVAEMTPNDLKKLGSMSDRGKEYADMIFKFRDDLLNT